MPPGKFPLSDEEIRKILREAFEMCTACMGSGKSGIIVGGIILDPCKPHNGVRELDCTICHGRGYFQKNSKQ